MIICYFLEFEKVILALYIKIKIVNMNINKTINQTLMILLIFFMFYKAYIMIMTYDEAYTYLNYSYTKDFKNLTLANNHYLNSLLIYFSSLISEDAIFIRLPNIISGIFYLFLSYKISMISRYSVATFILFCSTPVLIDFFVHARGYGISTFLNLLAVYLYFYLGKKELALLALFFSSLSIPICLIVLFSFFPMYLIEKYKENKLKISLFIVLIFSTLSAPIIFWTFRITQNNLPLFGLDSLDLKYLFLSFFGFLKLYMFNNVLVGSIFFIIFIMSILKLIENKRNNIWIVNITVLFLLYFLPLLFSKPFPTERILVPFWPFFLFQFSIFLNLLNKSVIKVSAPVFIFLVLNFFNIQSINESLTWNSSTKGIDRYDVKNNFCTIVLKEYVSDYYKQIYNLDCS